jgi:hypothetical protein
MNLFRQEKSFDCVITLNASKNVVFILTLTLTLTLTFLIDICLLCRTV